MLHHICSTLELGTLPGPVSVLPDYADVVLDDAPMPAWASRAFNKIRKSMSRDEIAKRWAYLQADVIPKWKFYAMPHSILCDMGSNRPKRAYWPNPGPDAEVIEYGINILSQAQAGTLPRVWASHARIDGYIFDPKEEAREAKEKQTREQEKEVQQTMASRATGADVQTGMNASKSNKARSPVPSVTDSAEGKYLLAY